MKTVDLAVVVPTLNEEKYIGRLLDSIYSQTVWPKEIFIVDATSRDLTIQEIKKWQKKLPQLKFCQIPKFSIARQRNLGVNKTSSSKILFLDADTVLVDPKTLEKYLKEAEEKNARLAVAENFPLSHHWKDIAYFQAANLGTRVGKFVMPAAVGINIYCKRSVFEKLGGFDESIKVGEDIEMIGRFAKKGVLYEVLEEPKIYTSVRRLRKEGRIRLVLMMINSFINTRIFGYRGNPIVKEYEFGKHSPTDS
ncbi:glycosyltransferase [Candidatus Daviesbacteria bacterium]|nr:glycosyltransferase [Candidatus Daviesbacteria bacterium]